MNRRTAQEKISGLLVLNQDGDIGGVQRAGNGIDAELVNIGDVVGVSCRFSQIEQNSLLIVFAGGRALAQIGQDLGHEQKMRGAHENRDERDQSRVSARVQSVQVSAAAPTEENSENNNCAHQFDQQD